MIQLDDGIRSTVLALRQAGYATFTSCEGGRGHPFSSPTVGLRLKGNYFRFRAKLVRFLYSQGRRSFEVTLVSSFHPKYPRGKHYVYLTGFDLASPEKRRKISRTIKQRERRLARRLDRKR